MPRIQNIEQFQINLGKNKPDNQDKDVFILVRTLLGTSGRFDWIPGTKLCMAHAHLGKPVWFVSSFQLVQHGSGKEILCNPMCD